MNYLIKITAVCLLTTLSITSYAQTIKSAISSETVRKVKLLNMESERDYKKNPYYSEGEAYKYTLTNQETIMKDVDSDGIKDAITLLYYCEATNCHPTTRTVDLVVFKGGKKNQYTKVDSAPLGVHGKIESISNNLINVKAYYYNEDDASCCPSTEASRSYKIRNNKLYKVK